MNRIKAFVKSNLWFIIGFILITLFVFSNCLYGYKLSFTNLNYSFAPFNTYDVKTDGPLLSDVADSDYPLVYKTYYSNTGFSMWDSDLALGTPSNAIAEYINPMKWVYLLPFDIAIFFKAFSEFALAFFSMFLFLRALDAKKFPAAISGILYAFSSVIVGWLGWPHSDVAACAPLLFFAIERLISTIKIKYALLITLVVYVMLIVGMPTYAAYFLYLAGVYIVIFTFIRHWKNTKNIISVGLMFAVSIIFAALLSLPYTYTLLNSVSSNGYAESRAELAKATLSWDYLRTFIYPNLRDNLQLHVNESTLFAGITSIILLPLCFFNNKNKKRNIFFIISSLLVFTLIFTGALNFIFTKLPMINTSMKYRVITLLLFSLSVITGITINDIFTNTEYYRKRKWLLGIMTVWTAAVLFLASEDLFSVEEETVRFVLLLSLGLIACIFLFVLLKKAYKPVLILFAVLIVLDSTQFVKEYLPWIDADADIIPAPSDSVTYMMDNTKDAERIIGVGNWILFPNTPSYYELNDIRIHGFIATNSDFVNYYTSIDENAYLTRTNISIKNIENYSLLKYLGVKYLYFSDQDVCMNNAVSIADLNGAMSPLGAIPSGSAVSQDIALEGNTYLLQLLFATYGSVPESNGSIHLTIAEKDGSTEILNEDIPVSEIKDNSYLTVEIDNELIQSDKLYTLTLTFNDIGDDAVTLWTRATEGSTVYYNEAIPSQSLVINTIQKTDDYEISYAGSDSLLVGELDAYSDKAELVEKVYVYSDEEEVLNEMKKEYLDNTMFISDAGSVEEYELPLTDNEYIEVEEYEDDYVRIKCSSEYERYVMLNDYYNEDWCAYVNGQKTDIEKVNYLMRAVKVSEGKDIIIEFKYEPYSFYKVSLVSGIVLLVFILLFIFRNRLQKSVTIHR